MKNQQIDLFNLNKVDALNGIDIPFNNKDISPSEYKVLRTVIINSSGWEENNPISKCTNVFLNKLTSVKNVANTIASLEKKGYVRRKLNKYNNVRRIDLSLLLKKVSEFKKELSKQYKEHKEHLEHVYGRKLQNKEFTYNPNNPTKYSSKKVRGDSKVGTPNDIQGYKYKKQSLQDCKKVIHNSDLFAEIKNVNDVYFFKFEEKYKGISLDFKKAIEEKSSSKLVNVIKKHWGTLFPKVSKNLLFKSIGLLNKNNSIINLYEYVMHSICNSNVNNKSSYIANCLNKLYRIIIPKPLRIYDHKPIEEYENIELKNCTNKAGLKDIAKQHGYKVLSWITSKYAMLKDNKIIFKNDFAFDKINNNYGSLFRAYGFELISEI